SNGNKRLYHRKWLMLFSLEFQRHDHPNALTMDSADGKTGKGMHFQRTAEMKQPHRKAGLNKKPRTGQGCHSVGKWARRLERVALGFCSASQIWASRSAESA